MFCVRPEHFDKTYRLHIPDKYIERVGRRVLFKPEAIRAVLDGMLQAEQAKLAAADGDTMLAGGGDSPSLERYRKAKAEHAELDLEVRREALVPRDQAHRVIDVFAARIRSLGVRMAKRFGKDASGMIKKTLEDAHKEVETRFGSSEQ